MSFKLALLAVVVFSAMVALAGGCAWKNVGVVVPDEVIRSAQPSPKELDKLVRQYHIKSVLNLRGAFPGQAWYDDEMSASTKAGVTHYDYELSSDDDVTLEQQHQIVALMENAPKPILIHCAWGADRTGLAAALYRYGVLHHEASDAVKELSPWYGHVLVFHPKARAMDRSFQAYVAANHAPIDKTQLPIPAPQGTPTSTTPPPRPSDPP